MLRLSENKRKIENKINELDEMLTDLIADQVNSEDSQNINDKVNINRLHVMDIVQNILN